MKKILTILGILLSSFVYGQKFSYEVLYEGSNGDSLTKTDGLFKISRVRKTNFVFHKAVLTIKTDSINIREKIVFFYYSDGVDTFFDIGVRPKNQKFTRIIGMPETISFFLNDNMVYYIQMVPQKKGS